MPYFAFLVVALLIGGATVAACFVWSGRAAAAVALLGAFAILCVNALAHVRFYADDAYITLRYSLNLSNGLGPVWNEGERVEGYTNFSWMVLLAGMHRIGFDLVDASYVLSFLAMAATMLVTWRIWAIWADEAAGAIAHPAVLAVALIGISLSGGVAAWVFSGLETPLAVALLTGGALLFMLESRSGMLPWSALALSAGAMTRPEMLGIAILTAGFALARAYIAGDRGAWRYAGLWFAVFVVTFATFEIWRYSYYGHPLPNTYYAKVGGTQEEINRGIDYVRVWGGEYLFLPLLAGLALLWFEKRGQVRRDAVYLFSVVVVWLAMVAYEGGDSFPQGRFLAPVAPILSVGGTAGLASALARVVPERRQYAIAALAAAFVAALALSTSSIDGARETERQLAKQRKDAGELFNARLPEGFTIGVIAAGSTPYYYGGPALDMLGLTDETIAHEGSSDLPALPGHELYYIDYVLEEARPEILLVSGYGPQPLERDDIEGNPSPFVPAHSELVRDPRTWALYEAAALQDDRGRWLTFLQRKDTLATFRADWTESGSAAAR